MDIKRSKGMYPGFKDFARFVAEEAQEATDPVYGCLLQKQGATKSQWKSPSTTSAFPSDVNAYDAVKKACVVCKGSHQLFYCLDFRAMKPHEHLQVVGTNFVKIAYCRITLLKTVVKQQHALFQGAVSATQSSFTSTRGGTLQKVRVTSHVPLVQRLFKW